MDDIFLRPGELYFGRLNAALTTVLGSCVAVTLWHKRERFAGMCHFVLPACDKPLDLADQRKIGRYADNAFSWLLARIQEETFPAGEYRVGVFGGGCMFPSALCEKGIDVGSRNVRAAEALLASHRMAIHQQGTSGHFYRRVRLDGRSGEIDLTESSVLGATGSMA